MPRTHDEAMRDDDVYMLDRLTHGTRLDSTLLTEAVDRLDEEFSTAEKARIAARLMDRVMWQDERTGRLGVEAILLKASRAIDWKRGSAFRFGKHGKPTWALKRRGKHAA